MNILQLPFVSIVIIGLDEEANLDACMQSVLESNYPNEKLELIYIDSGSRDNSIEIARKYTSAIYVESIFPSAAKSRNRGLNESSYDIVHFLDGDIKIHPDYLSNAVQIIVTGKAQAVCGKLIEINQNKITKIISSQWERKNLGVVKATHAGGTFLRSAIESMGGYNSKIRLGEETELGDRFIKAGFTIWYLDLPMGYHNYEINSVWQYFSKQINDGKFKTDVLFLKDKGNFYESARKHSISNLFQMSFLLLMVISVIPQNYYFSIGILGAYILFPLIKSIYKSDFPLAYISLMHYSKPWVFWGQILRFFEISKNKKLKMYLKICNEHPYPH